MKNYFIYVSLFLAIATSSLIVFTAGYSLAKWDVQQGCVK